MWRVAASLVVALAGSSHGGLMSCSVRADAKDSATLERFLQNGIGVNAGPGECGERPILGQHIAMSVVPYVVADHISNPAPEKPLVLTFVGPTGVGKSFLADRLADSIFNPRINAGTTMQQQWTDGNWNPKALLGKPNTLFISAVDYRDRTTKQWHEYLDQKIRKQVHKCKRSLIVLDEVHFFPLDTLEYLIELTDFKQPIEDATYGTIDFSHAIFLFTSNTGATNISAVYNTLLGSGRDRTEIEYRDFTEVLEDELALSEPVLVSKNRVDYYIPFLPMGHTELSEAIEWTLERLKCTGVAQRKFDALEWDAGTVQWLSRTDGSHSYNLTEAGLSRVAQHVQAAIGVPIDRALRKSSARKPSADTSAPQSRVAVAVHSDGTKRPTVTVDIVKPTPGEDASKSSGDL